MRKIAQIFVCFSKSLSFTKKKIESYHFLLKCLSLQFQLNDLWPFSHYKRAKIKTSQNIPRVDVLQFIFIFGQCV